MPSCRSSAFPRPLRGLCVAVAALLLSGLAACTSAQIDSIPASIGGIPEAAPKRPENPPDYPPVHDMPPTRTSAPLDAEHQKKLEADLIATRDRQVRRTANPEDKPAGGEAAKGPPAKKAQVAKKPKKPAARPSGTGGAAATTTEGAGAGRNP